jgi:hypothetical protein
MKINTQKLLLFLYEPQGKVRFEGIYAHLRYLFPDLTAEGRRSLIHHLKKQYLIDVQKKGRETIFQLTPYGRSQGEILFPILTREENSSKISMDKGNQSFQGNVILFFSAPTQDPHFRFLRKLLEEEGAHSINRGMYLFIQPVPEHVLTLCKKKYFSSVFIFSIAKWELDNHFLLLKSESHIDDFSSSLSGIGKEMSLLTEKKIGFSVSNHQHNLRVFSLFERLFLLFLQKESNFYLQNATTLSFSGFLSQFHQLFK